MYCSSVVHDSVLRARTPTRDLVSSAKQFGAGRLLPERSDPCRLLENDPSVVLLGSAGWLPLDRHLWARPNRQSWAAAAARFVAHDVPPFRSAHKSVAVGERAHSRVHVEIMARADDVPDLMCQAVAYRRAVKCDGKRLLRIGVRGCQASGSGSSTTSTATSARVFVAQAVNLLHVAVALIGEAPEMVEVGGALLDVVGLISVHQPQLYLAEPTHPE